MQSTKYPAEQKPQLFGLKTSHDSLTRDKIKQTHNLSTGGEENEREKKRLSSY